MNATPLVNKPYVNEVTLSDQNLYFSAGRDLRYTDIAEAVTFHKNLEDLSQIWTFKCKQYWSSDLSQNLGKLVSNLDFQL